MALLLLFGCAKQSAEKTYRQITMEEAITMMEEETGCKKYAEKKNSISLIDSSQGKK